MQPCRTSNLYSTSSINRLRIEIYIEKWREAHLIGLSWEGAQEESNLFLLKDSSMLDKVEERREWMSGWEIEVLVKEIAIPGSHSHPLSLSLHCKVHTTQPTTTRLECVVQV